MSDRLSFISDVNFKMHVRETIKQYDKNLEPYNIDKFNRNIIDPIKLIFDKSVYGFQWNEIIQNEVFRQRDKSTTNDIGYFHQKIFAYMNHCVVPKAGWDVIFTPPGGIDIADVGHVSKVYVEMKNKHNTMNSAASGKTYIKMQSQLLEDDDCVCCLVEAIAKRSQNISWQVTVDGQKKKHKNIRRLSMDQFYEMVTGVEDAFFKMCMVLPSVIEEVIHEEGENLIPHDTVYDELKKIGGKDNEYFALAIYLLAFSSYTGFSSNNVR